VQQERAADSALALFKLVIVVRKQRGSDRLRIENRGRAAGRKSAQNSTFLHGCVKIYINASPFTRSCPKVMFFGAKLISCPPHSFRFSGHQSSPKKNNDMTQLNHTSALNIRTRTWGTSISGQQLLAKCRIMVTILLVGAATTACTQSKSDSKGTAPSVDIHTAVVTGNKEALLQHIKAGTNINEKDPFGGSSPLISAAVFGKPEEAKILIDAGADLNFQNNDGSTALHTAAFFCRPEIVKMLLTKGADKNIKNKYGATPYMSVAGSFEESKGAYDMMGKVLGPMGLKLDYSYIEKTRPEIATMLK